MLKFNELRIDSNKNLIIDASVLDMTFDPSRIIPINHIKVGVGSTVTSVDYISQISVNPSPFDRLDYHKYYEYTFTVSSVTNINVGDTCTTQNNSFVVLSVNTTNSQITCTFDGNSAVDLDATGTLTIGTNTVTYSAYTNTTQKQCLRGFKLKVALTTLGENAAKSLIYVNVSVDSTVVEIPSCAYKTEIIGYTYDRCLLTNGVFDYIKTSNNICENIDNYANYILQTQGLELAIESGNFTLANTYWTMFFADGVNGTITSNNRCGCQQ